jgi:hypothetical protein
MRLHLLDAVINPSILELYISNLLGFSFTLKIHSDQLSQHAAVLGLLPDLEKLVPQLSLSLLKS